MYIHMYTHTHTHTHTHCCANFAGVQLTDISEMSLLFPTELGYNLSLQVSGETLVQPKFLPCPVGYQVTCPAVGHLMSHNHLNQRMGMGM